MAPSRPTERTTLLMIQTHSGSLNRCMNVTYECVWVEKKRYARALWPVHNVTLQNFCAIGGVTYINDWMTLGLLFVAQRQGIGEGWGRFPLHQVDGAAPETGPR